MATADLSHVNAHTRKGYELFEMGHLARSAEHYARGAVAAAALPGAQADSLIVAYLRVSQANALLGHAASSPVVEQLTLMRDMCTSLSAAMRAIEARHAAGSLLRNDATEEAWWHARRAHMAGCVALPAAQQGEALRRAALAGCALLGYEACLRTAHLVTGPLCGSRDSDVAMLPLLGGAQAAAQFVAHATAMLAAPRTSGPYAFRPLGPEAFFVTAMRKHITWNETMVRCRPEWFATGAPCGFVRQRADEADAVLERAWRALERSGVLRERRLDSDETWEQVDSGTCVLLGREMGARAAPGLRCCALASCAKREAHPSHFKRCGACAGPVYCCKAHQAEDWPTHKAACKAARKAAAETST
jgi:hypothetical protein